jgi:hypothetical protein
MFIYVLNSTNISNFSLTLEIYQFVNTFLLYIFSFVHTALTT